MASRITGHAGVEGTWGDPRMLGTPARRCVGAARMEATSAVLKPL